MLNCTALKAVSSEGKCPEALANRLWDRWRPHKPGPLITYKVSSRIGDSIPKVIETTSVGGISQGQVWKKVFS